MIYAALGHAFCKRYHIRSFVPIKDGEMLTFTHQRRANHVTITGRGPYRVEFWQIKKYGKWKVKVYADVTDLPAALAKFARLDNATQERMELNGTTCSD